MTGGRTIVKDRRGCEDGSDSALFKIELSACASEDGEGRSETGAAECGSGCERFEQRVGVRARQESEGQQDRTGDTSKGGDDGEREGREKGVERGRKTA